jgi:superfamily II DNA/RNA helicase
MLLMRRCLSRRSFVDILSKRDDDNQSELDLEPAAIQRRVDVANRLASKMSSAWHIVEPTDVQELSMTSQLCGKSTVLCAETGSGKTLGYLLPLAARLLCGELVHDAGAPGAIVLLPSTELATQVAKVADVLFADEQDYCSAALLGESIQRVFSFDRRVHDGDDDGDSKSYGARRGKRKVPSVHGRRIGLLVTTPSSLRRVLAAPDKVQKRRAPIIGRGGAVQKVLAGAGALVVDEADMMMFGGLADHLDDILTAYRRKVRRRRQVVLSAATIPGGVSRKSPEAYIRKRLPDATWVRTDGLHRPVALERHEFVPVADDRELLDRVRELLTSADAGDRQHLLFVNTVARARDLAELLGDWQVPSHAAFHRDVEPADRADALRRFADGELRVLVATNLAARGIDFPPTCHVVQVDFAESAVDHLHRIGRTSRAGHKGSATSFYAPHSADLVAELQQRGAAIRGLGSDDDDQSTTDISHTFSRGRSFRRRMKRRRQPRVSNRYDDQASDASDSESN